MATRKTKSPVSLHRELKPLESPAAVTAFVNRVIGKLNTGFSLLLKKRVALDSVYPWEKRVKLAVFYQYMRLRYKIPYYVSMAAFAYYWRKTIEKNFNSETGGIGLRIESMYGDGAEDAILSALSRPRFRTVNAAAEFYNELMRALMLMEKVPAMANIADLELAGAYKNRDAALKLIESKKRAHRLAVRAVTQELERAVRAPYNPVLDKESVVWYQKNSE